MVLEMFNTSKLLTRYDLISNIFKDTANSIISEKSK